MAQKKGGEPCEKDSDCQTKACSSGKCDPCPDRNNCPPPGTCSDSELSSYRDQVTKWCKNEPRSCIEWDFNEQEVDCSKLKARLEINENCLKARDDVMQRCFKGGDDAHRKERENVADVRNRCNDLIRHKKGLNVCYECSDSDYNSYRDDVRRACEKTVACDERKDDSKVDCSKLEDKYKNAQECLKAQEYIKDRCFNGYRSSRRQIRKDESEKNISYCKEVWDYKKDKQLCQ